MKKPASKARSKLNPKLPVYVMEEGFALRHIVSFSKSSDEATLRAIPDDVPDTTVLFDRDNPPNVEDFSIVVTSYKALQRWVAHVETNFWYDNGAAALLQLSSQKYAFYGDRAMTFEMQPRDEVIEFRVRLDGARPVSWIHGKNNVYLLSERTYVPIQKVHDVDNPYQCIDRADCAQIRNVVDA